jgi:hypothetical protein
MPPLRYPTETDLASSRDGNSVRQLGPSQVAFHRRNMKGKEKEEKKTKD